MSDVATSAPLSRGRIAFFVLLVIALLVGALLVPIPQERERLALAVSMWPGSEPFIIAREAGELPPEDINLVEINWTSAAMRAVGNGVVDAAILSLDEVVRQTSQGHPLRIVLITDISQGADLLLARPGVTQVEQLKGARIGFEPRTAGATLLGAALRQAGLTLEDIQPVPLNPAETEEIIEELMLDAVVSSEPWRQNLKKLKLQPIYDSSHTGMDIIRVLVVHEDALTTHREAVRALVRAHLRWMKRLPSLKEELEPVLRREDVEREGFLQALRTIEVPSVEQNMRWLAGEDMALVKRLDQLSAQLALDEGISDSPPWEKIFDASILREVMP